MSSIIRNLSCRFGKRTNNAGKRRAAQDNYIRFGKRGLPFPPPAFARTMPSVWEGGRRAEEEEEEEEGEDPCSFSSLLRLRDPMERALTAR